jgi:hypothetical protein
MDHGFEEVDRRFERVDADIRELRGAMKSGFDAVDARFDSLGAQMYGLQRTLIRLLGTALGSIVVGLILAMFTSHL